MDIANWKRYCKRAISSALVPKVVWFYLLVGILGMIIQTGTSVTRGDYIVEPLTASMRANVLERIEIRTVTE